MIKILNQIWDTCLIPYFRNIYIKYVYFMRYHCTFQHDNNNNKTSHIKKKISRTRGSQ